MNSNKNITIIVAVDQNNGIGKNNQLLCYLPNDLKRFKNLTTGNTIIMGRKTFESLPNGALPNRRNIVISRQADLKITNAEVFDSIQNAIDACATDEKIFIIGGDSIYKQTLANATYLEVTYIASRFDADTFFPIIDANVFKVVMTETFEADEKNKYSYSFITYQRQ